MKALFTLITPHQGLGDHILCNGIYRYFSQLRNQVLITVKRNYVGEIRYMLRDCSNVRVIPLPLKRSWTYTRLIQLISSPLPIEIVGLGSYGENFFKLALILILDGVNLRFLVTISVKMKYLSAWGAIPAHIYFYMRTRAENLSLIEKELIQN